MKDVIRGRAGQNNRTDAGSPTRVPGDSCTRKCFEGQVLTRKVFEMEKDGMLLQICYCLSLMDNSTTSLKNQRHCLT